MRYRIDFYARNGINDINLSHWFRNMNDQFKNYWVYELHRDPDHTWHHVEFSMEDAETITKLLDDKGCRTSYARSITHTAN